MKPQVPKVTSPTRAAVLPSQRIHTVNLPQIENTISDIVDYYNRTTDVQNAGLVRIRTPPNHKFQQINCICRINNSGDFIEHTKCAVSHVHCRSVTEYIRFKITQLSLQRMTDGDGDLGQEG